MDWVGIIIQLILGAIGGYGTGRAVKQVSINPTVDAIVGLIGGYLGTWIVGLIPGLAGLVSGGRFGLSFDSLGKTVVEDHVAGARVAVPGLADRADVDQELAFSQRVFVVDLFGGEELEALGEHPRNVGVPLEAVALDKLEQPVHLAMVVDVLGEDVLAQRIPRRPVDEQKRRLLVRSRQVAEELPTPLVVRPVGRVLELAAGPEDGALRPGIESLGIKQRSLIMVAENAKLAPHNQIDALARIRTVADDVAEAEDFVDPLTADIAEHGLKAFEVAMNVADQGTLHES